MRKNISVTIALGIIFLFFIQMAGSLVESIYILDLLNTQLDEKVLGLLFFFTPVLLLGFRKKPPPWIMWIIFFFVLISRGVTPYLDTAGRMLASGIGIGSVLLLLPIMLSNFPWAGKRFETAAWVSSGAALGVGFSVFLRTVNHSLDYSLSIAGGWSGWVMGLLLGVLISQLDWGNEESEPSEDKGVTTSIIGLILVLTLSYFLFSAPAVLVRWTNGNYPLIVTAVIFMSLGWTAVMVSKPVLITRIPANVVFILNIIFALSLISTILVNRVSFPQIPDAAPVVLGLQPWSHQIPLLITLLTFPIIFLDLLTFAKNLLGASPTPRNLVPGLLLGVLILVVLVFINIFTNVWGYVEPVSLYFRNMFWLPFALISFTLAFLVLIAKPKKSKPVEIPTENIPWMMVVILGAIFVITGIFAVRSDSAGVFDSDERSLLVMTYNIQQANDASGEKSYKDQLDLIRMVSPDILALQESDSARISLNNNDYVRYFASKLRYYSYYGPNPVTGTYGTAILSKFPLRNPHTIFSFSDQDEIGTAVVDIVVGGKTFTIFNVHPAGSDTAMMTFAETLLEQAKNYENVIALGDYNLRESESAYQLIDDVFKNAWIDKYADGISVDGIDMSGDQRIDHIFVSPHLLVRDPVYVLAPESATDHPVHWAEVYWEE